MFMKVRRQRLQKAMMRGRKKIAGSMRMPRA